MAALPFIGLGVFIVWESRNLKYYSEFGPGAGFLPFWVGAVLTLLSLTWLGQVTFRPVADMPEVFLPGRAGTFRVLSIVMALVVCALLLDRLGFSLTMFAFLAFLLFSLGRQNLVVTIVIAVAGGFGVCFVFERWLGVFLPKSSIAFLRSLGL